MSNNQSVDLLAEYNLEVSGYVTHTIPNIGFVSVIQEDRTLHIRDLYVTPTQRRKGHGTALFNLILKAAREFGCVIVGVSLNC